MENWSILDGYAASPVDPSCDAAYTLKLARGDEQVETIVEFAAPSAVASRGYAEEKLGAFLRDDEPPQRVVVERDGSATVAAGPRLRGDARLRLPDSARSLSSRCYAGSDDATSTD